MSSVGVPERTFSTALREEVQSLTLPSGLRVLYCPKPGFKKRYACYSTFYGSVDSEFVLPGEGHIKVPDGIAHFLEHTLFETDEGNVSDLFAKNGAYNNAATSFTTTTYLFASTDRFYENLKLLLRFVEGPTFRPEKVEKEKGIIEQEIRGYEDSAGWVSYMGLLENLFAKHPMRIDIAGTVESIQGIDSETLHRCYRAFYHPTNMVLFVIGDLDAAELFDFVATTSNPAVALAGQNGGGLVERIYAEEPTPIFRRETRKVMEVALPKLLLGFKETTAPTSGKDYMVRELASELALEILFGPSSNTFRELYEKQLVLDDFSASYSAGAGIGYAVVGGDTPQPDTLRDTLLERVGQLLGKGMDSEDFEREKRRFIGGFVRSFNSLEYIASHYTYYLFHGFGLFEAIDVLAEMTHAQVEERLQRLLDVENYATFVVEPKSVA